MILNYVTLGVIIGIVVLLFLKGINLNITVNVEHNYPEQKIEPVESSEEDEEIKNSLNDMLKEINSFMLDQEELVDGKE